MIKVEITSLAGVLKITLDIFEDHRGQYIQLYNEADYGPPEMRPIKFVQDDISVSYKNVLRGIHGDSETWKLISCLHGRIYLVVVDCDEHSSDFNKWEAFIITATNGVQVLVPPEHGVAHLVLSDKAIFHYKQSTYYSPGKQFTYGYDDKRFNIKWPIKNPILSERDANA